MGENNIQKKEDVLFKRISQLIDESHRKIKATINTAIVYTNYGVGSYIVEDEQQGEQRAVYGQAVQKRISEKLTDKYSEGWSVETLKKNRTFFQIYSSTNGNLPQNQSKSVCSVDQIHPFTLSWSHYLVLMRIKNDDERNFYEIENQKQDWSVRQLQRQYASNLYERLALNHNKDGVMRLAKEGQTREKPNDVIKNPLTLEFLGLKADDSYSEIKLESTIISKMHDFLLEMGKGFLFEARQKRFTFDEEHFYVDLIFYNRLLQCYCLIDLKQDKLTHQDFGQMQMCVNYFDRYIKQDFEKPTIGILLCKKKNDVLVDLTLPKDANVYASAYELYLPNKALLQSKVKEWIEEFEEYEPDAENINKE